jgi:copper chaperone CopZ
MVVDGERMHVKPGATVIVPQGVRRGVEAETRLAFLGSHSGAGATQESARPFLKGGLAALLGLMLMVGLMIVVPLLFSGSNPLAMMFASGLEPSLGMWGLMLLPFAGLLVMVALMFAFFRLTSGRDGSMAKMMSRGGIMAPMMGHQHDHERGQHKGMPFTTDTYNIPSVNCGHCQMTIEKKVGELTGVASVHVDVDAKRAVIKYNSPATRSKIETLLVKIGHPPQRA